MKKNILITGANGYLGTHLVGELTKYKDSSIYAFDIEKSEMVEKFAKYPNVTLYDSSDFEQNMLPFDKTDILIHCAFARANKGEIEIAKSINFTYKLFSILKKKKISLVINISSQEVYGICTNKPWKESYEVGPNSVYGCAKYFSEILSLDIMKNKVTKVTNLRLAAIIGYDTESRLVSKFVDRVMIGEGISIIGGDQKFSQIDIRDVVNGIEKIINNNDVNIKKIYNLGYKNNENIIAIAEIVNMIGSTEGYNAVKINVQNQITNFDSDLDSELFYNDFQWQPEYSIKNTIKSIFKYKKGELV